VSADAGPALALLEIGSLAHGYLVADRLVKVAAVELLAVEAVSPGKLVILSAGREADVEEAHMAGRREAGDDLIDELYLPNAHPSLRGAIAATITAPIEALGLIECRTVASGILSADAAAKASPVRLLTFHAARGIGGRTLLLFTGPLHDVEASREAGSRPAEQRGHLHRSVIIPSVHPDLVDRMVRGRGLL
jgi:microcompartment protein CcmL/EutN